MSDWEEIRRLAADFQRAQLAGSVQKLSERNCIEIVTKLIELKLLEVIYTCDGKEYLTPHQLTREIKDEVYLAGGRASLVELSSLLNVDFSHVEHAAQQIVKSDRETHLVLGQLVSHSYLDNLAREVNERLQQRGTIAIPSLTKEYDLPADFLLEQVSSRLGSIIEGFRDESDPKVILTPSHVARNRARIRGVLSAVSVPTSIASILTRFDIQERLFFSLADELIRTKRLPGIITGGKSASKATYIPNSYARAQNSWIESFYASNGYLEYDGVSRLGISDPEQFLRRKFREEEQLLFLNTCLLGPGLLAQIENAVEEALSSGSWVDLMPVLPSILSEDDIRQLIQSVLKNKGHPLVLANTVILSTRLVEDVRGKLEEDMAVRAKQDVDSGAVAQSIFDARGPQANSREEEDEERADRKEERRKKAAGGKAGGGAQGRETKTKSTKKKGGNKKRGEEEDWGSEDEGRGKAGGGEGGRTEVKKKELFFKTRQQLEDDISNYPSLADCPDEVFSQLAEHLMEGLNRKYREVAREMYQAALAASLQTKRRTHSDLQEKINSLHTTFRMCEKALHEFSNEEHKSSLSKHLVKTTGTEIVSEIFLYLAEENMIKVEADKEVTTEQRVKIMNELPKDVAEAAQKVHKAVLAASADDFLAVLEEQCQQLCDVMIKKPDKKRERQILFGHRQQLAEQLLSCTDPALTLHLAVILLFQHFTGCMLHASGKFVPLILAHLKDLLSEEQREVLVKHQQLVVSQLTGQEGDCSNSSDLADSSTAVKALVAALKKSAE